MNDLSLYRCLGNPTRLRVLKELKDGSEFCVSDLVEVTGSEQTNLSHHLAQLRACGLVVGRQEGKRVCYKLAHPRLAELLTLSEDLARHIECVDAETCSKAGCC